MKRNLLGLALALSLVFALTGCTSDKAPNVTPSPSTSGRYSDSGSMMIISASEEST